jgi:Golgi nucleoside diphosphatase
VLSLTRGATLQAVYRLRGTGDFLACRSLLEPLLNITHDCLEAAYCAFNNMYQPPIDFRKDEFWGLSEFWYTFDDIFSLGTPAAFVWSLFAQYCSCAD